MSSRRFAHIHEQVAEFLRSELHGGRWEEEMPGRNHLVKLLEVSGKTVDLALQQLETEGLLVAQGAGKKRRIVMPKGSVKPPSLRVRILLFESADKATDYHIEMRHRLEEAGHEVALASKSLQDLGMKPERVARYASRRSVDAWVVCAGSREVLEWFARQATPVFALFGRRSGLPIAGGSPRKIPAMQQAVDELVGLGHRRIVMLTREERRKPYPALHEEKFLERLQKHGIEPGPYNLPSWKDDVDSFHQCIEGLFELTPPTAIFISEPQLFFAAMLHLGRRGIRVPEDVSILCEDPCQEFTWCQPAVTHISWDASPLIRRVVKWATHVAQGRVDIQQTTTIAKLHRGGTIGPAPMHGKIHAVSEAGGESRGD